MSIRTKDEMLGIIRERFADDTSDEVISIIEDITDTFDDYNTRLADQTNWHEKYTQNDNEWRQKYKERFFGGGNPKEEEEMLEPEKPMTKPKTFEELFKEG